MAQQNCSNTTQVEIAEAFEKALELIDEDISLLELTKQAVPDLSEDSIRNFIHFLVNGKTVTDADTIVTKDDLVKVVPCFAGGK